ncbi:hypothetical protein H4219_002694 [Mycoemilia scoparia]|uniref:Uncharacterized protein n=1 Tax=Mycoemilia scoparia TaxID=417184 RepID=A0A9W8A0L6_9FUNG|nr:hypothetical protein H4219_002694 [Mycoemilia scoparia]
MMNIFYTAILLSAIVSRITFATDISPDDYYVAGQDDIEFKNNPENIQKRDGEGWISKITRGVKEVLTDDENCIPASHTPKIYAASFVPLGICVAVTNAMY